MSVKYVNLMYSSLHEAACCRCGLPLLCWVHTAHSPPSLLLKVNLHKKVFPDHPVLITRPLLFQPTLCFSSQYPSLITSMLHIYLFITAPRQQGFSLLHVYLPHLQQCLAYERPFISSPPSNTMIHLQQGHKFFHHICLCISSFQSEIPFKGNSDKNSGIFPHNPQVYSHLLQ